MTIARWTPPVAPTRQEQFLLKRLDRVRKLLGFLRLHRHELFDEAFQDELAAMYRTTGAGKAARPPALMAMAMLVQGYLGMSDAEMVELTVVDLRVQTPQKAAARYPVGCAARYSTWSSSSVTPGRPQLAMDPRQVRLGARARHVGRPRPIQPLLQRVVAQRLDRVPRQPQRPRRRSPRDCGRPPDDCAAPPT